MSGTAYAAAGTSRRAVVRAWAIRHRGLLGIEVVWLIFAANFNYGFLWGGDAQVPYAFVRRLFGADVHAVGYQFGLAFFEAPWYALGKVVEAAGVSTIRTHPTPEAAVALGAAVYVGLTAALAYATLRALRIRYPALAAGIALFGSPLFFYGTFSPGQTHAVDTLLSTSLAGLVLLGFRRGWSDRIALATGAVVGAAASVRWFEATLGCGLVLALLLFRRYRPAALVSGAAALLLALLLAVPLGLGIHVFAGGYETGLLHWSPASPLNMLLTLRRGLFVWTPVTALAVVGYALLARRRPDARPFLVTLGLMALALFCAQALVPFWDAGWSYSQRYFTSLFPLFAVGIAGLLEVRPRLAGAASAAAIAWSLFLCLAMVTLPFPSSGSGGVGTLVHLAGRQSFGSYTYGVYRLSHLRFLLPYKPFANR